MVPESGDQASDNIMLKQKLERNGDSTLRHFAFMAAQCGAECAAERAAAERRVGHRRVGHRRVGQLRVEYGA